MLKKKMLRDIRKNLSQFITIFLMILLGLMVYSGIRSYMQGMKQTAEEFYTEYNLQDLDVMGYLTREDQAEIKKINGVKNVEGKVTLVGTIADEEDKTIQINFIDTNKISKFYIKEGEGFSKDKAGVWISEYYARNNNLKVGDVLKLKYDETIIEEKIVGIINVPDHVYSAKDTSEVYPNHRDYGFCYMSINEFPKDYIKEVASKAMNLSDKNLIPDFDIKDVLKFTSLMVELEDNANKSDIKRQIETNIEHASAVMDIEDENSYTIYQTEIDEGETYAGVFTTLFLLIAILSVVTTMTRVVKKQRIQIGTLKALGISNKKINRHYVSYILWIASIATILGIIAGPFTIGKVFIGMEMNLFQIPNGRAILENSSFIIAVAVVLLVCFVTYLTCHKELKKNPAETLRTEMPKVKSKGLNFTAKGLLKKLSFSSKWNIRDILRNKARTAMGIFGIAGCAMLLVCAFGMLDTMNHYIDWQFDELYNFEYKIMLKPDYTNKEFKEISKYYGTATSQTLGVEIKFAEDRKETNNIFVANSEEYIRFTNKNLEFIKLKDDGIYVTEKLAETEDLKEGDIITWHIYGDDTYYESKIVGIDRDPQNQNIKMTRNYLESLGIEYRADTFYTNKNVTRVKELSGIESAKHISVIKAGTNDMLNTTKTLIILIIVVAGLLGIVIIYNLGVLSFTEKGYQFATLKVLGFKDKVIKKTYIKQNNWITIISMLIGAPLGYYLTDYIFKLALSEQFDFVSTVTISSYVIAIIGTFVVTYIVSKLLARKIGKVDMITSLKGNE